MYGGLEFILEVCHFRGVTNGRVQVEFDNKKTLLLFLKRYKGYIRRENMWTSCRKYARNRSPFHWRWISITYAYTRTIGYQIN